MTITSTIHSALGTATGLPVGYGWVLFVAVAIVVQCFLHTLPVGAARAKYFNKKFMQDNGFKGYKGGYPDMGQGRFSDKLSLEDWAAFNNAQRVHQNYLEGLPAILVVLLIAGLNYTRLTVLMGAVYIVFRQIYTFGYLAKGPTGRLLGVIGVDLALVVLAGAAFVSAYTMGGGINGLYALMKTGY